MYFCDLPAEALMLIACFTPHPCAVMMNDLYKGDRWFTWLERWERRESLKYMGVYEDEIDYERKRRRLTDTLQ